MKKNIHIDGATRLYVIIGDPIVQAKSPAVYSQLFADRGVPAVMLPMHVHPEHMAELAPQLESIKNLGKTTNTRLDALLKQEGKRPASCRCAELRDELARETQDRAGNPVLTLPRRFSGDWGFFGVLGGNGLGGRQCRMWHTWAKGFGLGGGRL
jgi:hypothetical protein